MKSRRALSTVVGAVFAIIALTSTVTYVSYSMGILDNYNQSVLTKNQQLSDVNKEKFQISSVTVPNNNLNITVVNTGSVPINFTKIWIQNTTTSATMDWIKSYVPIHNFVVPGGVLTNIGQSANIIPTNSYNVKLVTSRGNTQQFTINSVGTQPVNIQLLALPPSVPSGQTTELTMIVTNNGTSILTNVVPSITLQSGTVCSAGASSPSKYNTLAPGSTAIFVWPVAVSGSIPGASCTYKAQLQNGQGNNYATATINMNQISFTSTSLSANTGVLTINYTSWNWVTSTSSGWQSSYNIVHGANTGFAVKLTNNDPSRTFYLSNKTSIVFATYKVGTQSVTTSSSYILSNVTSAATFTNYNCSGYPKDDYCISLSPGQSVNLSIGGANIAGSNAALSAVPNVNGGGPTTAFLMLYGKFDTSRGGTAPSYGQNIPFIAIFLT